MEAADRARAAAVAWAQTEARKFLECQKNCAPYAHHLVVLLSMIRMETPQEGVLQCPSCLDHTVDS